MKRRILCFFLVLVTVSNTASKKIDVAFLLDSWPSAKETSNDGRDTVKDFVRNIYSSFDMEDDSVHVALLKSGATAEIVFDFNTYKDADGLDDALDELSVPHQPSSMAKALDLANYGLFRNSGRPDAVKILVVIAKNKSTDDVSRAARDLRNSGVNIISVGIGEGLFRDDLQNMVSPPKQYNILYADLNTLEKLAPDLENRIRQIVDAYSVSTSSGPDELEEQRKNARCSRACEKQVEGERVPINCNNCKLVRCCDMCCDRSYTRPVYAGPIHLAFLLDESGELKNWNNFEMIKRFMKNLTKQFDISSKKTKFGLISFSNDNVQIYDLRSYHDRVEIDSEIDKLNYEGRESFSGPLNKGLDATQSNLFSESRDVGVPRILLVFDSTTKKDDQTEVKAFKLQASDVQTFCIGLGATYDKTECERMVEKPAEKHSLAAQVSQLNELQKTIMLMIVNDIADKYCPLCVQGGTDACRPCKTANHYIGKDEDLEDMNSAKMLKEMEMFDKGKSQDVKLKISDQESEVGNNDNDEHSSQDKGINMLKVAQLGTPLSNVDLVKGLLQTGTAVDSGQSSQMPVMASSAAGLIQQTPSILQEQLLPQQTLPSGLFQQFDGNQDSDNQNLLLQPQTAPANPSAQLGSLSTGSLDTSSVAPVIVDSSLLQKAVFGTVGKFQGSKKEKYTQRKHIKSSGTVAEAPKMQSGSPLDSTSFNDMAATQVELPTLPNQGPETPFTNDMSSQARIPTLPAKNPNSGQGAESTNDLPFFQAGPLNPGVTSSMPLLPIPFRQQTEVEDNVPPQFQSLIPDMRPLLSVASRIAQERKKASFDDEYKYDRFDKQGPFTMACKDLSDECWSYATNGGCDDWAPLAPIGEVKTMCKKSCDLCNSAAVEKAHKKSLVSLRKLRHRKRKGVHKNLSVAKQRS